MAKILVVDDDADFREALEEALRSVGFDVCSASSADEACRVAVAEPVDVVVSDIFMPGNGTTLPKRLEILDPPPPVILVTAFEALQVATPDGVFAYLQKPVAFSQLLRLIESALAQGA